MVDSYGRQLKKIVADHGCTFVRNGKGDHEIWFSPINGRHFTVDNRGNKRFTAEASLKQAGIKEKIR